jgi:hypothetical protein
MPVRSKRWSMTRRPPPTPPPTKIRFVSQMVSSAKVG